ncbi:MAG TPA: hypothetical protein V6D05_13470 [Stenomitos sp.]
MSYQAVYDRLLLAINQGPHEQQKLVEVTDSTFAYLNEYEDTMPEDEILGLRILLAQAQTLIGRYFGM